MKNDNIQQVKDVFDKIKDTTSRNDKMGIIREYSHDDNILSALYFSYNPYIHTGLSTNKITKKLDGIKGNSPDSLYDMYNYLDENNTGTDVNISVVQSFIDKFSDTEDDKKFLKWLFTKSLKIGITAKTINKALERKMIPEFNVQLAYSYEKYIDKLPKDFTLTTKLDGHRAVCIVDSYGDSEFFSRKGNNIDGLVEITPQIKDFANNGTLGIQEYNKGFVLDGELIVKSIEDGQDVFNETSKIIRKNDDKKGLVFQVFDIIPKDEFTANKGTIKYSKRRQLLDLLFNKENYDSLELVRAIYTGNDTSVIPLWAEKAFANGDEGIMVNDNNENYKFNRTKGLLKVKEFHSLDTEILDVFEGQGKYDNMLGGLVIDYKGNKVEVGSGFTDEQRQLYWDNKDDIIGKIIEVQYFSESTNQNNDAISLRFPTVKGIRDDKEKGDENID